MSALSAGHDLTLRDPGDGPAADFLVDAENVLLTATAEQQDQLVRFDCECSAEFDGDMVEFALPAIRVRVKRPAYPPDMLAKHALEEVALKLLAASRATEIVWREMNRVLKS